MTDGGYEKKQQEEKERDFFFFKPFYTPVVMSFVVKELRQIESFLPT